MLFNMLQELCYSMVFNMSNFDNILLYSNLSNIIKGTDHIIMTYTIVNNVNLYHDTI